MQLCLNAARAEVTASSTHMFFWSTWQGRRIILRISATESAVQQRVCILVILLQLISILKCLNKWQNHTLKCLPRPFHVYEQAINTRKNRSFVRIWKLMWEGLQFSSIAQLSDCLQPHGLQHTRLPVYHPPQVCSNSCPSCWWCHPTISFSVVLFSTHLQSLLALGSFQMSWFFASCGWSIGVSASASVLPMNIRGWSPLEWTGWISLQSRGLSRVSSNTTVQNHQFFLAQLPI